MSDLIDAAQVTEDLLLKIALENKKPAGPAATGECLTCGEEDIGAARFCCPKCARIWERRNRNGAQR